MKTICKDIFKAIYEGKWISIEYNNKLKETTKYWIAIKDIIIKDNIILVVDGLHVTKGTITELRIDLSKILSSCLVDGSYYPINKKLIEDIENNPSKYIRMFDNVSNLKILNYLIDCNRLDNVPYKTEYSLVSLIDDDKVKKGNYELNDEQYLEIIKTFQIGIKKNNRKNTVQLCLNILSINTKRGLYLLAYRDLNFDPINKCFKASEEVHICYEFTVNDGLQMSIRYFLGEEDEYLLNDFYNNLQVIEDRIIEYTNKKCSVDDIPYLIALQREMPVSLEEEYQAINKMFEEKRVTIPIQAFFGELIKQPLRKKNYPITLLDKKTNLDQLLAIHNATKYPITYVQGPPGTGKTNTIINTILTSFFNERTLLFSSYNNHPIDSVFDKLTSIKYRDSIIPFPVLRIGNNEKMLETLDYIDSLYNRAKDLHVYFDTLDKYANDLTINSQKLTELMLKYEEITELKERKETIEKLLESSNDFNFQIELQTKQLDDINKRLKEIGDVTNEEALSLVVEDDIFKKFLYFVSAGYIKKLSEPKYSGLWDIIKEEDKDKKVVAFSKYISNSENLIRLQKVFPIMCATCLSAHKIGEANTYFDMVVIDEASQCNTAVSLIPILRGQNLLLVGDPQQLNPVIQLDPKNNEVLKRKYNISDEYDYIKNSIYKTYLAADSISQEILLSHHYRCEKRIIDFCNKKYYHNKLSVDSKVKNDNPLKYVDIKNNESVIKNMSNKEVDYIVDYCKNNNDKNIGIITPFVNQKLAIENALKSNAISNVTCGTVHAFQGDEKDEIIFSLALTDKTTPRTYKWLKNNMELINVGVSRAKERLTILSSDKEINRLHFDTNEERDDIFELVNYCKSNGDYEVSMVQTKSRALGIKPYSTEIEEAFLVNLNQVLGNILKQDRKCVVKKEVAIASVFSNNPSYNDLFYSGRFDFVVYEKEMGRELPVLAIELDGKEHYSEEVVKKRDQKKNAICKEHGFDLIRIDNSYARRYNYLKDILIDYFTA